MIPKLFIVDLGMMLTVKPLSTRIRLIGCPRMYALTNNERLCGLEPNNKSSSVNVTMVLHMVHRIGLLINVTTFTFSAYSLYDEC